ncbi:SufB/SufD family protein [Paenirhodobacter sp.]|uniref:SufB/SufD family protein n=1 Tax=Paenirhodobacter sp. TaxID=1965326 RepID=UPI003B41E885
MSVVEKATRLDSLAVPDGFAAQSRRGALERLTAMGLPGRRDEYWRWTNPTTLNAPEAAPAAVFRQDDSPVFGDLDRLKVVFVDGVFDADASDDLALEGLEICRLAVAPEGHWSAGFYGTLEEAGQVPVRRPFAALNTAAATDGVLIRVTGRVAKPVHVIHLHESTTSDPILHHCVKLEPGAELTLLESGTAGARFNGALEVEVAEGARFHHLRTQGIDPERRAVTHIFARVAREGLFKSFTLTVNGRLTRNECVLWLDGDDAVAHVAGAALGDGDFHHDDTVFITHDALRGESRQVFKKVLKHGAVGVFQGKILVKPGAQKTDGYQISQALLMDDDSQFLGKPELEIYADDVKCSHGSTTGALDPTALFYLRSRGVPAEEARALLVLSFLADAIDEIEDEALKDEIVARLEGWLARHRG